MHKVQDKYMKDFWLKKQWGMSLKYAKKATDFDVHNVLIVFLAMYGTHMHRDSFGMQSWYAGKLSEFETMFNSAANDRHTIHLHVLFQSLDWSGN